MPLAFVVPVPTVTPSTVNETVAPATAAPPLVRVRVAARVVGPDDPYVTDAGLGAERLSDVAMVVATVTVADALLLPPNPPFPLIVNGPTPAFTLNQKDAAGWFAGIDTDVIWFGPPPQPLLLWKVIPAGLVPSTMDRAEARVESRLPPW